MHETECCNRLRLKRLSSEVQRHQPLVETLGSEFESLPPSQPNSLPFRGLQLSRLGNSPSLPKWCPAQWLIAFLDALGPTAGEPSRGAIPASRPWRSSCPSEDCTLGDCGDSSHCPPVAKATPGTDCCYFQCHGMDVAARRGAVGHRFRRAARDVRPRRGGRRADGGCPWTHQRGQAFRLAGTWRAQFALPSASCRTTATSRPESSPTPKCTSPAASWTAQADCFAVWQRRDENGRNVTFPARQFTVHGSAVASRCCARCWTPTPRTPFAMPCCASARRWNRRSARRARRSPEPDCRSLGRQLG